VTEGARATLLKQITEADWHGFVVSFATMMGWSTYHTYDSRRSNAGWPDLVCVRGDRLVIAELKAEGGKVTAAQQAWIDALTAVAEASGKAVSVHLWRPSDEAEVREVLA
jgi:hypothetical protein